MVITNKYYIGPNPNEQSFIWDEVVESFLTVRYNIAGNKVVIKTPVGSEVDLAPAFKEYTHDQVLIELANPEWTNEDVV
jgi:hypothetical protein